MISHRLSRLLLLSLAFICALLMLLLHIAAVQNGWYFSFKLLDHIVYWFGLAAVTILSLLYIQNNKITLAVLFLFTMLWGTLRTYFIVPYPVPPIFIEVYDIIIGPLVIYLVTRYRKRLFTAFWKDIVNFWKKAKEMFG